MTRHALLAGALALLGAAPAGAIVGPSADGAAVAPHVLMVLNRQGRTAGFCSGLVVAPTVVLTAAHCVPEGAAVKVHFRDGAGAPVLLDVAAIARSPGYRADAIAARARSVDLALLRLPAPLPAQFRAADLGQIDGTTAGAAFLLAGFGLTREGEAASSGQLRTGSVVAREPLSSLLLWAHDPAGRGTGACTGDSGGPVFEAGGSRAVALMVWSAGDGKARCGALTQAVWLGPQRAWIASVLGSWGL